LKPGQKDDKEKQSSCISYQKGTEKEFNKKNYICLILKNSALVPNKNI